MLMMFFEINKFCNDENSFIHIRSDNKDKPSIGELVITNDKTYTVSQIINNYDKDIVYVMLDENIK